MIALLAAVVFAADGGTSLPDGGEYVVLDVNHGTLWVNQRDGGAEPVFVQGGAYLDDDALMHAGKKTAFGRGALEVPPDVDTKTVLQAALAMFGVGLLVGFVGCSFLGVKIPWPWK